MNNYIIYLLGLGITICISLLVIIFFRSYLKKILLELNGDKERPAKFWVVYTNIILLFVPLVFAMSIVPNQNDDINVLFYISKQLKWSLIGLIISFFAIGLVIIRFVPKDDSIK